MANPYDNLANFDQIEKDVETRVKVISQKVSPWLWIFSVCGLVLAIWNKQQISTMYGNFKRMKKALLP